MAVLSNDTNIDEIMQDEYVQKILNVIKDTPKSAKQISKESGISICSVYRKLRVLKEKKILLVSGNITDDGIRTKQYLTKINPQITRTLTF